MSVFTLTVGTFTSGTGTADAANLTSGAFMAIQGGTATQLNFVDEVYLGGQATATAPAIFLLGRDSTVGATLTALSTPNSMGMDDPTAGVLTAPPLGFVASTTLPQRSNSITLAKKNYTFNLWGGLVRANYANTKDRFGILGNTASLGELSISAFTGTTSGAVGGHIQVECM